MKIFVIPDLSKLMKIFLMRNMSKFSENFPDAGPVKNYWKFSSADVGPVKILKFSENFPDAGPVKISENCCEPDLSKLSENFPDAGCV